VRIKSKLVILFSIIIVSTVVATSIIAFKSLESAVIDSQIKEMTDQVQTKANLINDLHYRAAQDLLFSVKNPVFVRYFDLRDTMAGNVHDKNKVIQFTPQQRLVKNELDQWIYNFQNRFNVDETCLVDINGQEITRVVLKKIALDKDLSYSEWMTPFFRPSFQNDVDHVYYQRPYVSPDTKRWVFAYTTPIVRSDGYKAAFYHFEMPMKIFQDLVQTTSGRIYVADPSGYLVADSRYKFNQNINSEPFRQSPKDYFPSINTISTSSDFNKALRNVQSNANTDVGHVTYNSNGELHYIVFKKLALFGWILAYEKPYSMMLSGNTNLSSLAITMSIIAGIAIVSGLISVFIISDRISRPIRDFAMKCRNQDVSNLQIINPIGNDKEINQVIYAFNEMIQRVNAIEKQKDEFASMVTHELKSPLTPIIGWCQTLKNPKLIGQLNSKQLNAVDVIQKNAKRLLQLVGDILDVQKLDLNKMKFDSQPVDVDDLLNYMYNNLQNVMAQKNIKQINSTKEQLTVISDRNRIEQVLNNLILNAVDFVPSETGKIEYGAQSKGDGVLFYVKDNGTGIPLEKQKNLFHKFYQIDTSVTRKHGGSGLGLAISKGIIESLGGKIWIESELGKGASFYFTIPNNRTKTAMSEKVMDVKNTAK
jgi:signal transduction histidine kinase